MWILCCLAKRAKTSAARPTSTYPPSCSTSRSLNSGVFRTQIPGRDRATGPVQPGITRRQTIEQIPDQRALSGFGVAHQDTHRALGTEPVDNPPDVTIGVVGKLLPAQALLGLSPGAHVLDRQGGEELQGASRTFPPEAEDAGKLCLKEGDVARVKGEFAVGFQD